MNIKKLFRKDTKSRGQGGIFGVFIAIGIGLIIVAAILGIGAWIQAELYDEQKSEGTPYNQTGTEYGREIMNNTLEATNTVGGWLNIYTIVAIAVAIIGLIFLFAGGTTRGGTRGVSRGGGRRRL